MLTASEAARRLGISRYAYCERAKLIYDGVEWLIDSQDARGFCPPLPESRRG
ncbi:hypothetical protein M1N18_00920 [Dehalococcoidales bacterium]|nr:hypothetical protein [Dehalococcoidales bacterium]MCL0094662.1 hypothetical protein [Dehalococcoidales bacterium]